MVQVFIDEGGGCGLLYVSGRCVGGQVCVCVCVCVN